MFWKIMKGVCVFSDYCENCDYKNILDNVLDLKYYIEAKKYYADLPYHNFWHALQVILNAYKIIDDCKDENIQLNEKNIYLACLLHDAWYEKNPQDYWFKTKEDYSCYIAEKFLKLFWESNQDIQSIKNMIMATSMYWKFETIEQKIVRASDLLLMKQDYNIFVDTNQKLIEEYRLLNDKNITLDQRKNMTKSILEFYISQNIEITQKYASKSWYMNFKEKVQKNLDKYVNSVWL